MKAPIAFLAGSFLSCIGDALLVFAVPSGLALETADIRSSVMMWFIPAIAMFLATYFGGTLKRRATTVRTDYALLMFGIGALELVIAVLSERVRASSSTTLLLISSFVFLYALAREGIPRLLYQVAVFEFFVDKTRLQKFIGIQNALNIIGTLIGTYLASLLVKNGEWRYSLLFDAITFVIFGATIRWLGKDPSIETELVREEKMISVPSVSEPDSRVFRLLLAGVPMVFGINALVWNHLPLLSEKLAIISVSQCILVISVARLPGMVLSFFYARIQSICKLEWLVLVVLALLLISTLMYLHLPSIITMTFLALAHGVLTGLLWPADLSARNTLTRDSMISFSVTSLRMIAGFQFLSCILALALYQGSHAIPIVSLSLGVLMLAFLAIFLGFRYPAAQWKQSRLIVLVLGLGLMTSSCTFERVFSSQLIVELPSVSRDLSLREDLTYSSMVLLNDVMARLFFIGKDLTTHGELVSRVERVSLREYILTLNKYTSFGEEYEVDALDVQFSIRLYLSKHRGIAGPFHQIVGAQDCKTESCTLSGLEVIDRLKIRMSLKSDDLRFIDRLASPWLMVFKRDIPLYVQVGECRVPNATGIAKVIQCDHNGVIVQYKERMVRIPLSPTLDPKAARLIVENPGETNSPTLTVLGFYTNPASSSAEKVRKNIMPLLRQAAPSIANAIRLRYSEVLCPVWMKIPITAPAPPARRQMELKECPREPLRITLDNSEPYLDRIEQIIRESVPCPLNITRSHADRFFEDFRKSDLGLVWFTPDFLDVANVYSQFYCDAGGSCLFPWRHAKLSQLLKELFIQSASGTLNLEGTSEIEKIIQENGYAIPVAEMNWWISKGGKILPIHPAGLFHVKLRDFL